MTLTRVNVDSRLLESARDVVDSTSDRAVVETALRRLIASKQKGAMIDGIAGLTDLGEVHTTP